MSNLINRLFPVLALGALVLTTSCSKNNDAPNNDPVAVSFTLAINTSAPIVKAANAAWAAGDKVGIFMVYAGGTTTAEGAENRLYTTTGGNTFAAATGNDIFYPVDGSGVDFIAYYPYEAGQNLNTVYRVDVADQTSQAAVDLMWSNDATAKDKTATAVGLTFNHMLSKVIINTTVGDGLTANDLAAMTVTIKGMNTAAPFDLKTGVLGTYSAPADIAALTTTTGSKYEAIVLPATFAAAGSITMEFALNNAKSEVFVWECPANEAFEPGKEYTYTMTISRTGVTFTCTINPWISVPRTGTAW